MLINANYVPVIGVPFRCEAFNSLLRTRNVFANRLAPSRDIARGFEVLENLRCLCGGSLNDGNKRYSVEPLRIEYREASFVVTFNGSLWIVLC